MWTNDSSNRNESYTKDKITSQGLQVKNQLIKWQKANTESGVLGVGR